MKIYTMKLTGRDGTTLAVANTRIGLLRAYNKYLLDCNCQKITMLDFDNEENIDSFCESGDFDFMGKDLETIREELLEEVKRFVYQSYPGVPVYYLGDTWNIYCEPDALSNGYIINRGRKLNLLGGAL